MSRGVRDDIETLRARELASTRGGTWTMTDEEFCRELADAWDEGAEAQAKCYGMDKDTGANPYRSRP